MSKKIIKVNRENQIIVADSYTGISTVVGLIEGPYIKIKNDYFQRMFGTNSDSLFSLSQFLKAFKGFCDLVYVQYEWYLEELEIREINTNQTKEIG